ncbi:polar amino acid transport system substrate-binding protein [Pseudoalteromonas citrea]|uniref:Polar amino acid transport system substrate-binding protein n=2 Tax=Pseudoalteromonas citrea TaxID=43655 RepID=A0AAD4AHI3_9GAMM|nr:transporter substrate-binding domain-containing protein [Pseudoalteromonas citrea]KAF7769710.1 polar amino acid transport system substrate-binding protein [Pseudoalteromonas citrea]
MSEQCKKIGIVASWPPLTVFDAQGATGLDVEIVQRIFERAKVCYQFVRLPSSARTFEEMQKGTIDVATMTSYTKSREMFGTFSVSYREEKMRLISMKKPTNIEKLTSILDQDHTIGLSIGSYYGEEIRQLMSDPTFAEQFIGLASANSRIALLMKGRVDFIVDDLISAHYYKTKLGHVSLKVWPYVVHDNPVHLLLSHTAFTHTEISAINLAIKGLQNDIDAIVMSYLIN